MIMQVACPACQTETTLSLVESSYEGPFRCWKCHAPFTIKIKGKKLVRYSPVSERELQEQQQIVAVEDRFK